jgi:hypothetical protein
MKAAAWFYSQSFHDLERVTPDVPTPPAPAAPTPEEGEWYDFPWGRRRVCPREHERNVNGCDVMTIQESDATCLRHFCGSCHDDLCCRCCDRDTISRDDAELCGSCEQEQAEQQQIDHDCDRPPARDDRTAADHALEQYKDGHENTRPYYGPDDEQEF